MVMQDLNFGLLIIFHAVLYRWWSPDPAVNTAKLSFSFEDLGGFEVDEDVVFCVNLGL
ncbi:hypothetical protein HO173_004918 [Letharia columbiana]|uniref:Uncharacterized protein n=1 Tax=Letharia columbiana TaxID=112416 RepID=A0A8H6L634_9LECA|nr:uncharacterized protein HO173_004918 [Letharia columbiana]KAF6237039.1 hypothetical protein HO173_004918 [Letharia columbiana]